jgi:hypothetical protein
MFRNAGRRLWVPVNIECDPRRIAGLGAAALKRKRPQNMSQNNPVFGIYQTSQRAEVAVDNLLEAGFQGGDISALHPDNQSSRDFANKKHTRAPRGTVEGESATAPIEGTLAKDKKRQTEWVVWAFHPDNRTSFRWSMLYLDGPACSERGAMTYRGQPVYAGRYTFQPVCFTGRTPTVMRIALMLGELFIGAVFGAVAGFIGFVRAWRGPEDGSKIIAGTERSTGHC